MIAKGSLSNAFRGLFNDANSVRTIVVTLPAPMIPVRFCGFFVCGALSVGQEYESTQ